MAVSAFDSVESGSLGDAAGGAAPLGSVVTRASVATAASRPVFRAGGRRRLRWWYEIGVVAVFLCGVLGDPLRTGGPAPLSVVQALHNAQRVIGFERTAGAVT